MRLVSGLALLISVTLLSGCTKPPPPRPEPKPAPVSVAAAARKTVPVQVRTIGSVKAVATVAVRPRVGGQLMKVHFKEGDYVTRDQPLFQIDRRPYDTAVAQAKANLAKSAAIADGAARELERQKRAAGSLSTADLDKARSAYESAAATVVADKAAIATAELQASFTTIAAPLDGRVGELLVNEGNLVEANSLTPLVVINQVSPIYVSFSLPEHQLPVVAAERRMRPLKVEAFLHGGEAVPGTLAFIDNAVNTGSGTVQLKAEFPNADRRLWPGQFVDVVLTVRERPDSVVVPAAAVQTGQQGQYVFVVTADRKAAMRPVTVAFEHGHEAVIASGLDGTETVVAEGQLRLTDGTAVDVKTPKGPKNPTTVAPASAPGPEVGQ